MVKLYLNTIYLVQEKRIDVVILFKEIIFCLEFKVGKLDEADADIDQVLDYALDLKKFHKFSQDKIR